jgi:hypothetical protein
MNHLRFSDVAYGIDKTQKTLRNWLQRDQVVLDSVRVESKRHGFSCVDVSILALVGPLVDFGFRVELASQMANMAIKMITPKGTSRKILRQMADETPGALAALWTNRTLRLWRKREDDWGLEIHDGWKAGSGPADVYLAIEAESVIRRAIERSLDCRGLQQEAKR